MILEQALKDVEDSSITGKAITADVLIEEEIILQFRHERTLKASYKDFETKIGAIVSSWNRFRGAREWQKNSNRTAIHLTVSIDSRVH